MKKILHYILLAVVCLASSCNDVMDLPYDGRTSLDALFTERRGVRAYLNSCYGYCPAPYMDRASLTDEAQDADDILAGSRYAAWYTDAVSASNYASYSTDGSPWAGLYEGIRHCNVFLERIKGVDPALIQSNADEVGGWTAQAHVLRALYYLQLIKRYGDVPLLKSTYEQNHDYTKDVRAPFSEVVEFIVEDCDAALAYSEAAFGWGIPEASFGIMTRAVPYAIKSQAVTYAASPLWSDGTYDWEDALEVSREALAVLLTHDYKLFDNVPSPGIAQNPYALYFITSSDDRRSTDKETILQVGAQMEVWRQAGLPSTPGQLKAGPCPSQELVDCYETVDGEPVLDLTNPYEDEMHLTPNYNPENRTYDPQNPYENRDPRFYASIYYNGAQRVLGNTGDTREFLMEFTDPPHNDVTLAYMPEWEGYKDIWTVLTSGPDPYAYFKPVNFGIEWDRLKKMTFSFYYQTDATTDRFRNMGFFFVVDGAIDPAKRLELGDLAPTNGQVVEFSFDMTEHMKNNFADSWGPDSYIRFDFLEQEAAAYMVMASVKITIEYEESEVEVDPNVYTYVGAADGISANNRRSTRTGYYMRKFNNWQSNVSNNADGAIRLFRLAEIYLNFAEAAYQVKGPDGTVDVAGTQASARDAVNFIRARAGMPPLPAGMSKDEFELRYRNERRVELAFEEHRFFDVRRWKVLDETDKCVSGMRITKKDGGYEYERIGFPRSNWRDKYYVYPLDPDEVNKMQDFTGADWQNPGW